MKRTIKFLAFVAITILFLPSCNDILDVNNDPTKVSDPSLDVLLPAVELRIAQANFGVSYYGTQIAHQLDDSRGYYTSIRMDGAWINLYLKALNNLNVIVEIAEENGSNHYAGIAKILQAQGLGMLTDTWENVPFSEAFNGATNITPKYDNQEDLYKEIFRLLDEGLEALAMEESFLSPGGDDMFYGGDMNQWIKLGHSLKARYMLHLSNKGSVNWENIITEVDMGIVGNSDNFKMTFDDASPNPWYTSVVIANETGNKSLAPSEFLVNKMNGQNGAPLDPRLPEMMTSSDSIYLGLAEWKPNNVSNVDLLKGIWYGNPNTPLLLFTAAESYFIKAEAQTHTGGDVLSSYNNGIMSHMGMLGVDPGSYITDVNDGDIQIDDILNQKFIALYLDGEVWTDMRRHHFDTNIFHGFEFPTSEEYLGDPAQRSLYPKSEETRNGDNMPSVDLKDVMWRDQQ